MRCATLFLWLLTTSGLFAQVSYERLLHPNQEPRNWLTYSGGYFSQRHSLLDQITPANVKHLELSWVFQAQSLEKFEATPIVVDGIMYVTQPPNDIVALDAKTGRLFWIYQYHVSPGARLCCGLVNRGLAILGDTLFMGTVDAHLLAIDARSGHVLWNVEVADRNLGYAITHAPLVVKDKIVVGTAGGEYGTRGFLAAYDARSGKENWRFYPVPAPGMPGHETWEGNSWEHGGGSFWVTGSYDPATNLIYWGTGNPGPDWSPDERLGDNLYTDSAIALDADTGLLKWHFQFTPHDGSDWDATQVPVLVDLDWNGGQRKAMLWANRNGFFYVLDRVTGRFLSGNPFVKQNWTAGLDENGRPIRLPSKEGAPVNPGNQGGTNWYSPSFSPHTGLFYVTAWLDTFATYLRTPSAYAPGRRYTGGSYKSPLPSIRRGPINTWTAEAGHGAVLAIDPHTGKQQWAFETQDVSDSGILTTVSDLLFTGGREGYF
ncbi:MAG TPA: PQQ-dependent dehydrogenase, methanol/ethanol family, partial [Edaphobacter sp.]|nr:PQQ-dependent dehydrogenase, methanol/ethanol family [Edaphobacter sp.]